MPISDRPTPMLEIRNLGVAYGQVTAIWDLSIDVGEGEIVAVVGPNGAGKTTLINAISGIVPVGHGSIRFLGDDVQTVPPFRRASLGLAQCPEGRKLFPEMTVWENLRLGAYTCTDETEVRARMEHVFELFPRLHERRGQIARTLSGGEQQMVAIGRSLMQRPRLLMLDEPSLGLAPRIVKDVFRVIAKVHEEGTPVLLVEQNVHQTLEIADRAYVIENGQIALEGTGRTLLEHPHMKSAYLGLQ